MLDWNNGKLDMVKPDGMMKDWNLVWKVFAILNGLIASGSILCEFPLFHSSPSNLPFLLSPPTLQLVIFLVSPLP
jgi:hypothetical protein